MNLVCCVAYEQNVIEYIFLLNFAMSFASAADHQASSAIVSKQTFYVKNSYTITFCSYATNFTHATSKFSSSQLYPRTIWNLFLGYRGISIIRGKIVAISNHFIASFLEELFKIKCDLHKITLVLSAAIITMYHIWNFICPYILDVQVLTFVSAGNTTQIIRHNMCFFSQARGPRRKTNKRDHESGRQGIMEKSSREYKWEESSYEAQMWVCTVQ